jgi:LysR family glycine cleavage system transcriptional activator
MTLQAAVYGVGIAMGPISLVADDLAAGRLVLPFDGPRLPSRSYCSYVPQEKAADDLVKLFCAWLEREGQRAQTRSSGKPPANVSLK